MIISYTPKELNIEGFDLCPQINVGGCPDPHNNEGWSPVGPNTTQNTIVLAHAHGTTRGYAYSNHICVRGWEFLNNDVLYHEYGHLVACDFADAHGEFYKWVMAHVLKMPHLSAESVGRLGEVA